MRVPSLYARSIVCALAVATAFAVAVPARAQGPTVALQCSAGFGETGPGTSYSFQRHLGDWTPFRIRVLNAGASVIGTLVVSAPDFSGRMTRYEKHIELPSGSQQAHEILARVVGANSAPKVAFEEDGAILAEIDVPISRSTGEQLRVGVVDREGTALNDISAVSVDPNEARRPFMAGPAAPPTAPSASSQGPYNPYGQPSPVPITPLVFGPADLPRHWLGFAGLDVLVLNDAPLADLDETQVAALRMWVANGGLLVVAGGADFPGLRRSGLDALLPVDVGEKRTVGSVSGLTSTYGDFESTTGALVAVGSMRDGATALLSSDGAPVIAERRYGAGWVRFVATDPKLAPLRGWAGTPRLWADLVKPVVLRGTGRPPYAGINPGAQMNLLYDLADVRAPLVGYYFLYLFVYLFLLGPLNYVALRLKGRLEYAWVTIPAAVLIFSLGTVAVARIMRGGNSMVVSVSVDQYFPSEGMAFSRSQLLLVPAAKDTYRVGLSEGAGCMPGGDFGGGNSDVFSLDQTKRAPSIVASMNTWDVRAFEVLAGSAEEPPVRVRAVPGGVDVTNASRDRLRAAATITREGVYYLGDLAAGASSGSTTSHVVAGQFAPWYSAKLLEFEDGKRLVETLAGGQGGGWATAGGAPSDEIFTMASLTPASLSGLARPVFVAIREGDKATATLDSGARERRLSFVVVYLEEGSR
jgi:hypothetical protein